LKESNDLYLEFREREEVRLSAWNLGGKILWQIFKLSAGFYALFTYRLLLLREFTTMVRLIDPKFNMTEKINHYVSTLNAEVVGEVDQDAGLALFRGLPYASVEKRWTHSRPTHFLESPFDATQFGPRCCQGNGPVLVSGSVDDPIPGDDEFQCLNLNIAVPKEALLGGGSDRAESKLPVMVWIHG
jgi:hypothetical protein